VVKAFTIDGYEIPAGWSVMIVPAFTQRLPNYFADPETFDPYRFLPPRNEDQAHPYAWVGFGGGPHQCLGEGVAKLEIKAFLTLLLRRYDLQLVPDQDVRPRYLPLSRPNSDVFFTYAER
ncbi:MAG TPA: cytochrome P450, partial [Ktedonobacterales bacterium]|nr:cytochrome P450 [Ktedonobacterales bacterium]